MSQAQWTAVDDYFNALLVDHDTALDAAISASDQAGLPQIQVAPNQGQLLAILAQSISAKSILEIGTLGGYSTIWLARAVPADGSVITLELIPKHAEVARTNVDRAGIGGKVDIRLGAALDLLPALANDPRAPFDLIFIDADKENMPAYFEWSLKLARQGSLIILDNVVRGGEVANPHTSDERVQGVRRSMDILASHRASGKITATAIQTVGSKGYDGLSIVRVNA